MKKILVTGSLAYDYIMDFPGIFADHIMPDKIHSLNLSFYLDTLSKQRGGNAGNIAYTTSLFNQTVSILSIAGHDFNEYLKFLNNCNVDTSTIRILKDEPTASAFIMTDKNDNQISSFYPGAIKKATTLSIKELKIKPDFAIICPDNPTAMATFTLECRELSIPYLFDPGMQLPRLTDEQVIEGINGAEILIANDYEMELIRQRIKNQSILKKVPIIITTLGEKGSVIKSKRGEWKIKTAKPKEVLDPTGAGDAYRAGFMAGYSRGFDLKTCGQMGAVAATYAIEKYGTQNHKFTVKEFKERYRKAFKDVIELEN